MRALALCLFCLACDPPAAGEATFIYPDGGAAAAEDLGRLDTDAAPACALDDEDSDGYGLDPACPTPDCDDANGSIHPFGFEACNGLDDDCDGEIDEGLNVAICGVGACRREVRNCLDGAPQRCTPGEPEPEICNAEDDDCDGAIDEGAGAGSCGVGACARQAPCEAGAEAACVPGDPAPEVCNGVDDDCDGVTDEGGRPETVQATYPELAARHDVCDGGRQRLGPDCNAAIHRFCAARDCADTGFGPLENAGDLAVVACLQAAAIGRASFAELAAQHPVCDGAQERVGPNCNAAIHRWCTQQGFVSGFGPLESGPDFVFAACLDAEAAEVVGTRYPELRASHPGCDGADQRIGSECNAAINRLCGARGFLTGYGPVENAGDGAAVVCLRR